MGVEYLDCEVLVYGSDLLAYWCSLESIRQGYKVRQILPAYEECDVMHEPLHFGSQLIKHIYSAVGVPAGVGSDAPSQPQSPVPLGGDLSGSLQELRRTESEWNGTLLASEPLFHLSTPESPQLAKLRDLFEEQGLATLVLEMRQLSSHFAFPEKCQPLRGIQETAFRLTLSPSRLAWLLQTNLEKQGVAFHPVSSGAAVRLDFEADLPTGLLEGRTALRGQRLMISNFEDIQKLGPLLPGGQMVRPESAILQAGPRTPELPWSAKFNHSNWLFGGFCLSARRPQRADDNSQEQFIRVAKLVPSSTVDGDPEQAQAESLTTALTWSNRWFPFFEPTQHLVEPYWVGQGACYQEHPWRSDVRIGGGLGRDSAWWAPGLAVQMVAPNAVPSGGRV